MAPATRLSENPPLCADYKALQASREHHVASPNETKVLPALQLGPGPRTRSSGIFKKAVPAKTKKGRRVIAKRIECSIWAYYRLEKEFLSRKLDDEKLCGHWQNVCNYCVQRLVLVN